MIQIEHHNNVFLEPIYVCESMFCNLKNEYWTLGPPVTFCYCGCQGSQVSIKESHCQSRGLSGSPAPPEACILHRVLVHHPLHLLLTSPLSNVSHKLFTSSASLIYSDGSPLHTALKVILHSDKESRKKSNFKQAIIKRSFAWVPFPTRDRGGDIMPA